MAQRRLGFFSLLDFNLLQSRLSLMSRLVEDKNQVIAIAPRGHGSAEFRKHGIEFVHFPVDRKSFNPIRVLRQIVQLAGHLRGMKLDALHSFTLRPNVYGALAAKRVGIPIVISTVTGLGSLYSESVRPKDRVLRAGVDVLTRWALRDTAAVIFQNPDDRDLYLRGNMCAHGQVRMILSSGVDTARFDPNRISAGASAHLREEWGLPRHTPVVMMVSRFIREKGILEFIDAARALRNLAAFVLVGEPDLGNPHAVPWDQIRPHAERGTIVAPGRQENIPEWLSIADVYAYPSYYREGIPRTVLEAMSMRLPIVTTDSPGCRETVRDGENGYLIPTRSSEILVQRLRTLLEDGSLRQDMGRRSREIVWESYSADKILQQYLDLYRDFGLYSS